MPKILFCLNLKAEKKIKSKAMEQSIKIDPWIGILAFTVIMAIALIILLACVYLHFKQQEKEKQKAQSQRNIRMMNEQELNHKL